MIWIWILLLIVLILFLFLLGTAWFIHHKFFGKRCEGNPNLIYFTADDFPNLLYQPIEFPSNHGQLLRGGLYSIPALAPYKALLIFVHGMGGGHLSYMTEINTLAKKGFLVLSYDQTGTCSSEGKSLGGFFQGVLDLYSALSFIKKNDSLNHYPVVLAGHSWGGYIVCQVLQFSPDVRAITAMSAFEDDAALFCSLIQNQTGFPVKFLKPFFGIIKRLKYGKKANQKTSSILKKSSIPVLLLHGENDNTVPLKNSVAAQFLDCDKNSIIKSVVFPDRFHNLYQTRESEHYLNEIFSAIAMAESQLKKSSDPEKVKSLYRSIDYSKMTEEDPETMDFIDRFLSAEL